MTETRIRARQLGTPIRFVIAFAASLACPHVGRGQRDLTEIPAPDSAAESSQMRLAEGAVVNLFAADPDIVKPIQINFDASGNLWVATSRVYPQIKPGQIADDQIIVLRDTDGDGLADRRTVFADGLLIPTGVLPDGPDAAYVAESTRLLYLRDTDGDGVADRREIVLSGFGTEDTHHLIHTLRWGPDGCVYFNQSIYIHSDVETVDGPKRLDGGGIWRFRPTTGRLEVMCKGFINPWGHVFDPAGESFVTDGAYFDGINHAFPDAVFVTSPGATRWVRGMNPGSPKHCGLEILSGSHVPAEWSGDLVTNDFRSHRVCRFTVEPNKSSYLSRQQPELLTTSHVAFRPVDVRMGPDGAIYIADWYNPIIQHGEVDFRDERRDREHGRVWRVSFPGRPPESPPEYADLSVERLLDLVAENDALWVRQFARQELWRRLKVDVPAAQDVAAGVAEQVPAGASSEAARFDAAVRRWLDSVPPDASGAARRLLETCWLSEVCRRDVVGDSVARVRGAMERVAANDSDIAVVAGTLRSLWRSREFFDPPGSAAVVRLLQDGCDSPHARVRMEAAIAVGQTTLSEPDAGTNMQNAIAAATAAVLAAAGHSHTTRLPTEDPTADFVFWQALRALDGRFASGASAVRSAPREAASREAALGRTVLEQVDWSTHGGTLAFAIQAIQTPAAAEVGLGYLATTAAAGHPQRRRRVTAAVAKCGDASQLGRLLADSLESDFAAETIGWLVQRHSRDQTVPIDAAAWVNRAIDAGVLVPTDTASRTLGSAVASAVAAWQVESAEAGLIDAISRMRYDHGTDRAKTKTETKTKTKESDWSDEVTDSAQESGVDFIGELATALASLPSESARSAVSRLAASPSPRVRCGAVKGLVLNRPHASLGPLVRLLAIPEADERTVATAAELVARVIQVKGIPAKLAKALESQRFPARTAKSVMRKLRSVGGNPEIEAALRRSVGIGGGTWKMTPELLHRIQTRVAESGDAVRGEAIYRRESLQCIACHGIGPGGGVVGPNLISLGGSSRVDYILESLVAPSARLKEGYATTKILTDAGRIHSGIEIGKPPAAITLRTADGTEITIPDEAIESRSAGGSLMPAGLVDSLTESELVDLVTFLSRLGRTPAYTVSTEPRVRSFEMLVYSTEANRRLNRTSTDTAASSDPSLKWTSMTSDVAGNVRVDELDTFKQHRNTPPTSFVRFRIRVPEGGGAGGIEVPVDGIDAWVDGRPTPVWDLRKDSHLRAGTHTVVLAIDRSVVPDRLRIRTTGQVSPVLSRP